MLCFRNIEYSGGIVSELMRKKLIIIISENIDVSAKSSTCIPINLKWTLCLFYSQWKTEHENNKKKGIMATQNRIATESWL